MKDVEFRTCNDVPGYPSSNIRQSASRVRQPMAAGRRGTWMCTPFPQLARVRLD
jgi:hypothetical protein